MFIAMNRFQVADGKAEEFERIWKERETYLQDVPGFLRFALLRSDTPGEYVSHSTWRDRDAFIGWTESEAFTMGHRQGSLAGVLTGPPAVSLYEAVITQEAGRQT
jgi:heme-degrading monooxygenase HmoA